MEVGVYFPNACIICSKTANLKRCSRCNMISYCNSIHQKEHWPKHKYVCGIIFTMMKERGVSHLFENLRGTDLDTWLRERMKMMKEADTRVRRTFEINEEFLFKHPRSCFVCHDSEQNVLKNCPGCPGASFCKEHPNSPIHDEDCAKIREIFELANLITKRGIIETEVKLNTFQKGIEFFQTSEKPTSMREFLEKFAKSNCPSTIFKHWKIYLSEFLSAILTVFSAFQKLEFSSAHTLTIHMYNTIDGGATGEVLLHLFPKLKVLKIVVSSPNFPLSGICMERILCPECKQNGKELSIDYLTHTNGEYIISDCAKIDIWAYCNIVASDNYDFSDVQIATNLLKMWSQLSCPLIITTLTEKEHNEFKKTIESIVGNIDFFFDGLNPFSSIMGRRNYYDGRFGMGNKFMIILKSKRQLKQKLISCEILSHSKETKISTKSSAVFYASVCHVCGSSNAPVTCKRCKMMFYCGNRHQEEHQAQHKDLCNAIFGMLIESGAPNLFDKLKTEDSDLWLRAKVHLMSRARSKLGRELLDFEKQMFLFPKTCIVCHESDLNVLKVCKCGVHLCNAHKKNLEHNKFCDDLSLAFKLAINDRPKTPMFTVRKLNQDGNKTVPMSMAACIDSFLNFEKINPSFDIPNLEKILISDFLTRSFTLLWCLEKLNYQNKSSLVVHLIGATNSEVLAQNYWKMVLCRFEKLKTLKIIFIGPEISKNSSLICGLKFPRSSLVGKNLQVESHALRYEEYFQSESFIQPNVIIGFNLHLHESDLESFNNCTWKETVLSLKQIDAPFILTAGSETRAQKDHKRLCHLLGKTVDFLCCKQNPFAGLIPERDFETEKHLFSNQYLIIYNKLYEGKLQKLDNLEDNFQSMTVSETEGKEENKLTTELKLKDLPRLKFETEKLQEGKLSSEGNELNCSFQKLNV